MRTAVPFLVGVVEVVMISVLIKSCSSGEWDQLMRETPAEKTELVRFDTVYESAVKKRGFGAAVITDTEHLYQSIQWASGLKDRPAIVNVDWSGSFNTWWRNKTSDRTLPTLAWLSTSENSTSLYITAWSRVDADVYRRQWVVMQRTKQITVPMHRPST